MGGHVALCRHSPGPVEVSRVVMWAEQSVPPGSPVTEAVRGVEGHSGLEGAQFSLHPHCGWSSQSSAGPLTHKASPPPACRVRICPGPWGQEAQEEQPGPALVPVSLLTTCGDLACNCTGAYLLMAGRDTCVQAQRREQHTGKWDPSCAA